MEKERKRFAFWKKSPSQTSIDTAQVPQPAEASVSSQDLNSLAFQPDAGGPEFVEKDVNFSSLFMPFVKNYVSNLSHNKSPTKLPYPPNFYYPASSLQHQMNLQMQHIDLLARANTLPSPQERFLAVLKYSLSTCSLTKFPYKPIIAFLGETAQSYITNGDDTTFYCGEQVERDPAGSAFYICNPKQGFVHEGDVALVPKFKQAHVHVEFVGQRRTALIHPQGLWHEVYVADVPDLNIRLLRMHTELGGTLNLSCAATGYTASIDFKDKPIFGGKVNAITGKVLYQGREIYHIEGNWDEVAFIVDSATKERFELFNRTSALKTKAESYPLSTQSPMSGEKEWAPLLECLHRRDWEGAKAAKAVLDASHHERLARFDANGGFKSVYFNKTQEGIYQIKDPNVVYVDTPSAPVERGLPTM